MKPYSREELRKIIRDLKAKEIVLSELLEDEKISNKLEQLGLLQELLLQFAPKTKPIEKKLLRTYRLLVKYAFQNRDQVLFSYYQKKMFLLDPIYSKYYDLRAQDFYSNNVKLEEWEKLAQEAEKASSSDEHRVLFFLITSHIKKGNLDASINLFKKKIKIKTIDELDIKLLIGILKLCKKNSNYSAATDFIEIFKKHIPSREIEAITNLKCYEVFFEIETLNNPSLSSKKPLWERAFNKVFESNLSKPNLDFFSTLQKIYQQIEKKHAHFQDIRVSQDQQERIQSLIIKSLQEKKPLSLLRLGDGEAYGLETTSRPDRVVRELKWWGQEIPEYTSTRLIELFNQALLSSDILGIPSVFRFLRNIQGSQVDMTKSLDTRSSFEILKKAQHLAESKKLNKDLIFIEHRCNQILFQKNEITKLMDIAEKTVLISRHSQDKIKKAFPSQTIKTIEIPAERSSSKSLPYVIDSFMENVAAHSAPGTLVLVAAGYAGKIFLDVAKKNKAVALDVGAIADYWVGLKTRQIQDVVI